MRHGHKFNKLGRTASHRQALLSNLASQLIQYKRITTTLAKAKALRTYVEPLITKSKNDSTHNRRIVFSYLQNKEAIKELFGAVSDKVADRPGGYTRIIKLQARLSDNADMALIELVDFNELYTNGTKADGAAKKTRRSRRRGGSKADTPVAANLEDTTIDTQTTVVEEASTTTQEEVAIAANDENIKSEESSATEDDDKTNEGEVKS